MDRYNEYKDSDVQWLGEIPSHWEVKRLASYFSERKVKVSDKDYEPLSVTKNGIFPQLENVAKTNDGDNRKLVLQGDFVINSRSDRKGSSGVSKYDGSVSLINIVLKPRKNVLPDYCNYILKGYAFVEEYYRNGRGIVADLWTTRFDEMKTIKICMPPLAEQQAIAAYLDEQTAKIDTAIAQQQKMIDLLNERKQIIINRAVTKGLNPNVKMKDSGVEWIGEVPEHWEICKLKALGTTINGVSHDSTYFGEGFPFVSYSDVYKNMELPSDVSGLARSSKDEQRIFSVEEGDVFFTRTSETAEEIGFTSTCMKTIPNAVFAGFLIRFRPYRNRIDKHFSKFYFRAEIHRSYFVKEMNLVIRASLSQQLLKGLPVLLPPLNEQKEIARFLEEQCKTLDNSIASYKKQIALLQERKQIIINDVVTGKVKAL